MATLKYFTRTSKKNEYASVRIRFLGGRKFDVWANTGKQIRPEFWNNKKGITRQRAEFKDGDKFQKDLDSLKDFIFDEYNNNRPTEITSGWLKKTIDKYYNPEKYLSKNTTLFKYISHFIENSHKRTNPKTGNPVCYKMRREYAVTYDYLKKYADEFGEPDFKDIDLEFYENFIDFLREKNLATNTIGKKIQTLKIFLNDAAERGVNQYDKYKSKKFKTLKQDSDNIYLDHAELKQFYNYDFSNNKRLEKIRDKFIVASWTGLRYSDLSQITKDKVKEDRIHLRQKKTGGKVIIPLYPVVKEIFEKYDYNLPKPISNQKYNEYLKEAAKAAGIKKVFYKTEYYNGMSIEKKYKKYELISSHTARRSFCTNAYKDNIPTLAIMAISGHKSESAFLKYIKADETEHADKIMEVWQKNGSFVKKA